MCAFWCLLDDFIDVNDKWYDPVCAWWSCKFVLQFWTVKLEYFIAKNYYYSIEPSQTKEISPVREQGKYSEKWQQLVNTSQKIPQVIFISNCFWHLNAVTDAVGSIKHPEASSRLVTKHALPQKVLTPKFQVRDATLGLCSCFTGDVSSNLFLSAVSNI